MGFLQFVGCLFIGFAIPIFSFAYLVSIRSHLVIVSISAAFFWLLSTFLSSSLWAAIGAGDGTDVLPIASVVGVLSGEIIRYLFYKLYAKAELLVQGLPVKIFLHDVSSSIASGIGFGSMSAVVFFGPVLAESTGKATYYVSSCSGMNIFLLSAIISMLMALTHVALMILAFSAFRKSNLPLSAGVVALHLCASATVRFLFASSYVLLRPVCFSHATHLRHARFVALFISTSQTWINTSSYENGCAISLTLLGLLTAFVGCLAYAHVLRAGGASS